MKQAYISTHLADAQSAGDRFHLTPIILLAQAALESGWGTSRLAREANNHFGIKCHKDWTGDGIYADDDEKNECFRKYADASESFEDHARFLKRKRYQPLFQLK